MAFKISRSAFKRLFLLPLLLVLFILFFYRQIANIYRNVEYSGNITVIQRAFDLFERKPTEVCLEVELLNVGSPEVTQLSRYPQLTCRDPGFRITENDCLVYVIKSNVNDWTLEDTMEEMGCRIYSSLLSSSTLTEEVPARNHSNGRVYVNWLDGRDLVNLSMSEGSDNTAPIDFMMIRIDSGVSEWEILSELMAQRLLSRVKHLSMGVNLCPSRSNFTESHFQFILNVEQQLVDQLDMAIFNVANDLSTHTYNPLVKKKTYCASQFSWVNNNFRQEDIRLELVSTFQPNTTQ